MAEVTERDRKLAKDVRLEPEPNCVPENECYSDCMDVFVEVNLCGYVVAYREECVAEERAARLKAEGERDEAQRIIGLQQAALDVCKAA